MSMEQFMIRSRASEGRKIYLADPGTGKLTEHWIVVRSRWCDEFQAARAAAVQAAFGEARQEDPAARKTLEEERRLALVASLVAGWSFGEFTPEAVMAFLREAPQICEQIDKVAAQDSHFFRRASGAS